MVRRAGIYIFEATGRPPPDCVLPYLQGAVVRVNAASGEVSAWTALAGQFVSIVLTDVSGATVADSMVARSNHRGALTLETNTPRLSQRPERIWDALMNGEIDMVVSDEACMLPALQVLCQQGCGQHGMTIERVVDLISGRPAAALGLTPTKGSLVVGADGDIVVFDSEDPATCNESDPSPTGRVNLAMLRGELLFFDGEVHVQPGVGLPVLR